MQNSRFRNNPYQAPEIIEEDENDTNPALKLEEENEK